MSHCVPELDANTEDLDVTIPSSDSKVWLQQHRKIDALDVANVPDQEFCLRASDLDGGTIPMTNQPHGKVTKNALGHLNFLSNFTQDIENTNWTRSTSTDFHRDGSYDSLVNIGVAGDPASSLGTEDTSEFLVASIDEDMLAYLYPLDSQLDRSYSMDIASEPPNSQLSFHKGSLVIESCGVQLNSLLQTSNSVLPNNSADTVMGLAARHSPGYKLTGEVLEEAGCMLSEPLTSKRPQPFESNQLNSGLQSPSFQSSFGGGCQPTVVAPRWKSTYSPANFSSLNCNTVPLNFAHFSRPAALAKANLQTLGVCGAKDSIPLQQHSELRNVEVNRQGGVSLTESRNRTHILSSHETSVRFQAANPQQASSGQPKSANCESNLPSVQETVLVVEEAVRQNGNTRDIQDKASELVKEPLASVTGSTLHADKTYQLAAEVLESFEPTTTTSLACSGNAADQIKQRLLTKGKKQPRELDDPTECQSQNAEEDSVELKKPVRGSGSKRTRAAEVHNLSERRRRDRINEKMKALQELIPNSNKTDKASMLDEAIEYLKMLQHQLQMMSNRSGLGIPPVLVSAGMRPMQIPHMAHISGMGMERGSPMGMIDMGSGGSGQPLTFFSSIAGSSHQHPRPPTISDVHERLSGPAVVELYNRLATGQLLQVPRQPINMNMYHPDVLRQWQQQQIHSQQVHDHLQPSRTAVCSPPQ